MGAGAWGGVRGRALGACGEGAAGPAVRPAACRGPAGAYVPQACRAELCRISYAMRAALNQTKQGRHQAWRGAHSMAPHRTRAPAPHAAAPVALRPPLPVDEGLDALRVALLCLDAHRCCRWPCACSAPADARATVWTRGGCCAGPPVVLCAVPRALHRRKRLYGKPVYRIGPSAARSAAGRWVQWAQSHSDCKAVGDG